MYLGNRLSLKHKELVFILSKAYKTMADQNLLSGVNLLQLFSGIFFFKCHNKNYCPGTHQLERLLCKRRHFF